MDDDMNPKVTLRKSLKSRATLFTLAIFLLSIWSLSFYLARKLQDDMQHVLGEQQFATVSVLAANIDGALDDRLRALEKVAELISPALVVNPQTLQQELAQRPGFASLFNSGVYVTGLDGIVIAEIPAAGGRLGVNFLNDANSAYLVEALKGKSLVGTAFVGKVLKAPVVPLAVPIRNALGQVIGSLNGVVNLGQPNFLDRITQARYGRTGGYVLIDPQHRLIITATDPKRIMEKLPKAGVSPMVDRFMQGHEGSGTFVNSVGVEVIQSTKQVPVAGWYVAAQLPTAEAFAPIDAMQQRMLLAAIFLTLLAGTLTWWMLSRGLAPMVTAANTLADMTLATQPQQTLPITRDDEIGALLGSFNRLLETLAQREEALKKSEQHLAITLNSISDAVITTDTVGHITGMNPTAERLTGWALAEALGQPITEVFRTINSETRLPSANPVQRVLEDGRVVRLANHFALLARDGTEYHIADSAAPIRSSAERIAGVVLVFSDISDKYRTEAVLNRQRNMMEHTETMARLGSFEWDVDANTVIWSPEMFRILGREPALGTPNLPGQADLFAPESAQAFLDAVGKAAADGTPYTLELMTRQHDGKQRPCMAQGFPERDASGRVVRVAGLVQDITERKFLYDALLANNQLLQCISKSQAQFITQGDSKDIFNNVLEQMLVLAKSEFGFVNETLQDEQGNPYTKVLAISNLAWSKASEAIYKIANDTGLEFHNLKNLFGLAVESGLPLISNDPLHDARRGGLPQGHPAIHNFLAIPFFKGEKQIGICGLANRIGGYDENIVNYIKPFTDTLANLVVFIQEARQRKAVEQQLRDAIAQQDTLLREIHHRVKNNLQMISSLLELQSDYTTNEQALAFFKDIQRRIQSMAKLHAQLYRNKNIALVDFAVYLRSLVADLQAQFGALCSQVDTVFETQPCTLTLDTAIPLGLVLTELVSNVFKHAFPDGEAGELRISLGSAGDGKVRLEVVDNGVGLPAGMDLHDGKTFGMRLIRMMVEEQLRGKLVIESHRGTRAACEIYMAGVGK